MLNNVGRRLRLSLLLAVVALVGVLGVASSSAAAGPGPETRVRANSTVTVDAVGQPSGETAGGVGCLRPSQPDFVSAPCVATNTADDAARFVVDSAGNTTLRAQGSNGWLNVSEHAAERMTERGITIDALDSTLSQPSFQYWQPGANAGWRTGFYDPASKVFATTANGEVVTVINNASQTYINNVMSRVPPP